MLCIRRTCILKHFDVLGFSVAQIHPQRTCVAASWRRWRCWRPAPWWAHPETVLAVRWSAPSRCWYASALHQRYRWWTRYQPGHVVQWSNYQLSIDKTYGTSNKRFMTKWRMIISIPPCFKVIGWTFFSQWDTSDKLNTILHVMYVYRYKMTHVFTGYVSTSYRSKAKHYVHGNERTNHCILHVVEDQQSKLWQLIYFYSFKIIGGYSCETIHGGWSYKPWSRRSGTAPVRVVSWTLCPPSRPCWGVWADGG